jgi:hypothetical protein
MFTVKHVAAPVVLVNVYAS